MRYRVPKADWMEAVKTPPKEGTMSKKRLIQPTRRGLMAGAAGLLALTSGVGASQRARAQTASPSRPRQPNILFVFSDQERYRAQWPKGLSLPGHEWLSDRGVTFHHHYCPATMCTSSRAVMMTGLTTPDNGMFENCDMRYVGNLSPKIPTIGHMLRMLGYTTAYKGKWHLNRNFDNQENRLLTAEMETYGFGDYFSPGDIIGHTLGGYQFDHLVAGSAITWMRRKGQPLNQEGKSWALFVSLVNPHDIMYFNTDRPGEKVQDTGLLLKHAARAPDHPLYKATWDEPLPSTLREPMEGQRRPQAHGEFLKVWNHVLGHIPIEEERWRRFNDYYINCTRAVDAQLANLLAELENLGLDRNTIIMFTSDHGEAAGAHGLHGKGPFAYQETIHLPFYVVHPDVKGGQDCQALTSHIDLVPTLMAMAGASPERISDAAKRDLPGHDASALFTNPPAAKTNDLREAVLFTYSGLVTNDSEIFRINTEAKLAGKKTIVQLMREGYRPDMKKRGSLRSTFNGRYKFTRYFSPLERNSPRTMDDLFQNNDVELFDLATDPQEMNNLARDRRNNGALIMAMNAQLERIIKAEMGADDGREMPNIPTIDWTIDRPDL